jgi:diguanylate cyclase (GGDEF)-like protein
MIAAAAKAAGGRRRSAELARASRPYSQRPCTPVQYIAMTHSRDEARAARDASMRTAMTGEQLELGENFDNLGRNEVERRLRRLAELEQLMSERSAELNWVNERLVAELYDRTAAQAEADRLERFDTVTGLPNRTGFGERLERAIGVQLQGGAPAAVVVVGIARLPEVRESLGYQAGDRAVRQIADRLRLAVRGSDVVARVGDDQFALLLLQLRQSTDAEAVARKLFDAVAAPLRLGEHELRLEPSVGVAVCPHDGTAADLLLARADGAMRYARSHGTGLYQFFRPDIAQRTARRLSLEAELRAALERDQFRVHFQPRIDLKTRKVMGAEALLRWSHPERGLLAPGEFLDVADETGLIVPIGLTVLRQACAEAVRWGHGLSVAVNLSLREFRGQSMVASVEQTLRDTGLPAARLQVEINESGLARALDEVDAAALDGLRAAGVRIALDDFGAGAASLSMLRRVAVDCVKIDGEFVRHAPQDARDAQVVAAIARLARGLGLRVVAEGVETEGQLAMMKKFGCHEVQGYLLGRPVPADAFAATLAERPTRGPARRAAGAGQRRVSVKSARTH